MVEVLRGMPEQVGDRNTIIDACVQAGMNPATVSMWLTFNEAFVNHSWAVWGPVGSNPSPARVQAIQASVREQFEPMGLTDTWDAAGNYVIRFKAVRSFLRTGTISHGWPAHLRSRDAYEALDADGLPTGTIRFADDHDFSWGWGSPAATNTKHGQIVTASFDLAAGTVLITAASE
jgi:hypothetical protein